MEIRSAVADRLAAAVRESAVDYARYWQELAGEQLRSLIFYGPVVTPRFSSNRHAARSLAVLSKVDLDLIRRLALDGKRFGKRGLAAPIIMTPDYIRDSLDTFPLELIEIQRHHATLLGDDFFCELEFQPEHVRLQCERDLKTLLIGMRQGLLASAGRDKLLGRLETAAAETLLRTLRGLLWLKGQGDADGPDELLGGVESLLNRQLSTVRAVLQGTRGEGWGQFVALYEDLEILREKADGW
ncbi:MAG: hypothetical protein JJ992_08595 [Planctomycetes bacterium]|nr:hypothetical protein [Planctomycetota bacterium]